MGSPFDFAATMERARRRFGAAPGLPSRSPRSDRGVARLPDGVLAIVTRAFSGQDRPRTRDLLAAIAAECRRRRLAPPSRATVYKWMDSVPCRRHRMGDLPAAVRATLFNLAPGSAVPAHQVVFCCFNHGDLAAMSFAAGMPWLALHQALRVPGFRGRSRGLLEAVARARGI